MRQNLIRILKCKGEGVKGNNVECGISYPPTPLVILRGAAFTHPACCKERPDATVMHELLHIGLYIWKRQLIAVIVLVTRMDIIQD